MGGVESGRIGSTMSTPLLPFLVSCIRGGELDGFRSRRFHLPPCTPAAFSGAPAAPCAGPSATVTAVCSTGRRLYHLRCSHPPLCASAGVSSDAAPVTAVLYAPLGAACTAELHAGLRAAVAAGPWGAGYLLMYALRPVLPAGCQQVWGVLAEWVCVLVTRERVGGAQVKDCALPLTPLPSLTPLFRWAYAGAWAVKAALSCLASAWRLS